MSKITKEQAIILTGYTGFTCCKFSDFHQDVEKRLERPIWTHQMGTEEFRKECKELYKEDFLKILPEERKCPMDDVKRCPSCTQAYDTGGAFSHICPCPWRIKYHPSEEDKEKLSKLIEQTNGGGVEVLCNNGSVSMSKEQYRAQRIADAREVALS